MKREIKFRAWHENEYIKGGGYMHYFGLGEGCFKYYAIDLKTNSSEEWTFDLSVSKEVMQYTGLKDENGVEIYEGDIWSVVTGGEWSRETGHKDIVTKGEVKITTKGVYIGGLGLWANTHIFGNGKGEVIGNIHENPELL